MSKLYLTLIVFFFSIPTQAQHSPHKQLKKTNFKGAIKQLQQHNSSVQHRTVSSQKNLGSAPEFAMVSVFKNQLNSEIQKLATDAAGNIYAAGEFSDTLEVEGFTLTDQSRRSIFLAKFSPSGSLQWIEQVTAKDGGYPIAHVTDLEVNGSAVYVAGKVSNGSIQVNNQTISDQIFLAAYSLEGSFEWSYSSPQTAINQLNGSGITNLATTADAIYFSGEESIEELSLGGEFLKQIPVPAGVNSYQIAILNKKLLLAGSFEAPSIDFGSIHIENNNEHERAFLASYDLNLQRYNLAIANNEQQKSETPSSTRISTLKVHKNAIYLFGSARDPNSLEWQGEHFPRSTDWYGIFALKFNEEGSLEWMSSTPSSIYNGAEKIVAAFNENDEFVVHLTNKQAGYWFLENGILLNDKQISNSYQDLLIVNAHIFLGGEANGKFLLHKAEENLTTTNWEISDDRRGGRSRLDGLDIDKAGNLYHLGELSGQAKIFNTSINGNGLLVSKTNAKGKAEWTTLLEGAKISTFYRDIKVNSEEGAIYITGYAEDAINVQGISFEPEDGLTGFIARISLEGEVEWIQHIPRDSQGIDFDSEGNVYVSGSYSDSFTLGSFSAPKSQGGQDAFLLKFAPSGNPLWGQHYRGESMEWTGLVAIDKDDNIYFSLETVSRDIELPGANTLNLTEDDGNILLSQLNTEGNVKWTKVLGSYKNDAWLTNLGISQEGNIILNGFIGKEGSFGDTTIHSPFKYNHFVATLLPDGNTKWVNIVQSGGLPLNYNGMGIDKNGNVYIGGRFEEVLEFTENEKTEGQGLYIAKYNANGIFEYAKIIGTEDKKQLGGFAVSNEDDIFVNGYFNDEAYFDDQKMSTSANSGFLLNLSNIPSQPPALQGSEVVAAGTESTYILSEKGLADEVLVNASPDIAIASYTVDGSKLDISWNDSFTGAVSLSVAYRNHSGNSPYTDPLSITVSDPTGLDEELFGGPVKLYPNPAASYIQLELPQPTAGMVDVQVKDISGRTVSRSSIPSGSHTLRISTENLHNGMYLIQLTLPEGSKAMRFIKN